MGQEGSNPSLGTTEQKGEPMSDAPSVYKRDDGVIMVRASAFGDCMRKLWAVWDGVQPMEHSDVTKRAFKEGHLHEEAVTQELTQAGYHIAGDQTEIELKILPGRLHVIGHIDGIIELRDSTDYDVLRYGNKRLWECKAMSRNAFEDWVKGRFDYRPGYAWQLSIYMLGTELDKAHYSVKRRDDGVIDTWLIDELPKSEGEIRSRALKIYKMLRSGEMPACDGTGGAKWFCEFWFLHDEEEIDEPKVKEPIDNIPELDDLLAEYNEAVETEKWARAEKARIKEAIGEYRNGRDKFGTDHYRVNISHVRRGTFDKTRMIAEEENGQELVNKYTTHKIHESWKIEPRKG